MKDLSAKYNIPVPRYTSYPPANFFAPDFTESDFLSDIGRAHLLEPRFFSFYVHIPFCHQLCFYCGCNATKMRPRSELRRYVDSILKHLDLTLPHLAERMPVRQIHYGGGSPTSLPVEELKRINDHIRSAFPLATDAEIAIECHPGYIDEKGWLALLDAGFNRISIGVQDFAPDVLKAIGRRAPLMPIEETVQLLHERNIGVNLDFIYGLTGQSPESFAKTIERAIALNPERIVTFSYAHLPWLNPDMKRLEEGVGLPSDEVKAQIRDTAASTLINAGYEPIGIDHFVKPDEELAIAKREGRLGRNFQGYCTSRTTGQVIALGTTGISQLPHSFAQNVKDTTVYMEGIESGKIPIERGYALTGDEAARGALIQQLMCNGRAPIQMVEPLCDDETSQLLQELLQDGLITMDDRELILTDVGHPYVRNVAAAFDPHYRRTSTRMYSKPV